MLGIERGEGVNQRMVGTVATDGDNTLDACCIGFVEVLGYIFSVLGNRDDQFTQQSRCGLPPDQRTGGLEPAGYRLLTGRCLEFGRFPASPSGLCAPAPHARKPLTVRNKTTFLAKISGPVSVNE